MILLGLAHAECLSVADVAAVRAEMATTEVAYGRLAPVDFRRSLATLDARVGCLGAPLPPEDAARLHRIHGLASFLEGELDGARRAFAASLALAPSAGLPVTAVPDDPELEVRLTFEAARALVVERAGRGQSNVWFDGSEDVPRPQNTPTVYQHTRGAQVTETAYLWPEDPLPRRSSALGPLLVGGVGLAAGVAGGALYASSWLDYTGSGYPESAETGNRVYPRADAAAAESVVTRGQWGRALLIGGGVALAAGTTWVLVDARGVGVGWTLPW